MLYGAAYQVEKNTYSDSQFMKDYLEKEEAHQEQATVVADGAYSGKTNEGLAAGKNVELVTTNTKRRAEQQKYRGTEEFKELSNFRNGVEAIPSILRRKYRVDHMPVRGLIWSRVFFGCKIGALNFGKCCKYMQGCKSHAPNTVMA
ncbi:transposase [uncultured Acetatifactor sp.]|uniref:transposase n=1 Tax=uncultured Acetatifactor sp. TaxID=1671927 RepID=UPI0026220F64|nr:transposase [uncultured Acetatifactor sp.]